MPEDGPGSLASFPQRAVARLLDATVGIAIAVIAVTVLSLTVRDGDGTGIFLITLVLAPLIYGAYEVATTALRGQTLGKAATGIRVARIGSLHGPGWGRSLVRWGLPALLGFIPIAASPLILLPYLLAFADANRRGMHDKAAGTIVVRAR